MSAQVRAREGILLIRMSAMGDILHALPVATSLKKSFPESLLTWLVAPRWMPLLEGNPYIDQLLPFDRSSFAALRESWNRVRSLQIDTAFDLQGLLQSAVIGRAAKPARFYGFDKAVAREPLAASLYTNRVAVRGPHRIERNLQLIEAYGARELTYESKIPEGRPEGDLPAGNFVLTSPFAGWPGKEWPLESYDRLAEILLRDGLELVANVPEHRAEELGRLRHIRPHVSSLSGLIWATRRALAVVGLDSGPVHLAAALGKPGVALYGPTDPASTGPFGGSMAVLRSANVETTYKRHGQIHASMKAIYVEAVAEALLRSMAHAETPVVRV